MEDRRRWLNILVPALLVGASAVLMLGALNHPDRIIFDETYYVNDARDMLEQGVEQGFVVHPPLGKILIATSIRVFGDNPAGWRMLGALAGVATVLMTYFIGLRLFKRTAPAALAGLLLAVDGVFLVQARTAMLDIYLAFFVVLGAWALVVHHQRVVAADKALVAANERAPDVAADEVPLEDPRDEMRVEAPPPRPPELPRRDPTFLLLSGVAFGLAAGVKWSGLLALGAAGLIAIGIEIQRRRRLLDHWWRRSPRAIGLIFLALIVVPMAAYLTTWTPWMAHFAASYQGGKDCGDVDACTTTLPGRVAALGRFHESMWNFHSNLEADHSYRAPAYTWPVQARPVVFYYETCSENRLNRVPKTEDDGAVEIPDPCTVEREEAGEMIGLGNLVLWWGFLVAGISLIVGAVRGDPRTLIPLAFYVTQFLPWLAINRPVFSFYTVPLVPFMALGVAAAVSRVMDRERDGAAVMAGIGGALIGFLLVWIRDLTGAEPTRVVYGLFAAMTTVMAAGGMAIMNRAVVATPRWEPGSPARAGRWLTVGIAVAAVGVAIFFLPVWTGVTMDKDLLKMRWWFRGWI